MGYIRCVVKSRRTDNDGNPQFVRIGNIASDMADTNMFELPILMHALATKGLVEIVLSCFGSGVWYGNKPWIGSEKWKGSK